jgi:hypothetical protein
VGVVFPHLNRTDAAGSSIAPQELLHVTKPQSNPTEADTIDESPTLSHRCPCCGGRTIIIETFERSSAPHYRPAAQTADIRIDTS